MTTPTWPVSGEWQGLPPGEGPATVAAVTLEAGPVPTADAPLVEAAVQAVNTAIRSWNCAALAVGLTDWPADITRGANMLAGRLYRRKNSPGGIESFGDLGPVYVQRRDPDIAMLLSIGTHAFPQVG